MVHKVPKNQSPHKYTPNPIFISNKKDNGFAFRKFASSSKDGVQMVLSVLEGFFLLRQGLCLAGLVFSRDSQLPLPSKFWYY